MITKLFLSLKIVNQCEDININVEQKKNVDLIADADLSSFNRNYDYFDSNTNKCISMNSSVI